MANSTDLVVNIVGNAKSAVDAFDQVGEAARRQEESFNKVKAGITVASAVAVAAVAKFGADSIAAYSEAEGYQAQLTAAYEKFPGVANVSIDALRALNTEIQHKTGYDDDQIAASQATLAQFGLTGDQIEKLTPLMADYAAKTGKDITSAAEDMGKAVMGQGRALKTVGVDFTDTGDKAGNFDQLIAGLDGTVGGFADTMGDTAAGKAQILAANFGDLQETVGEMLMPALTALTDIGTQVTQWLSENPSIVQALAIAIGVLTIAIVAANVAMWAMAANPIVLIIMAIIVAVGLLIAGIWLLVSNWDAVVAWITQVWSGFMGWITGVINGFVGWWNSVWGAVGAFIGHVWNDYIVAPIRNAVNWIQTAIQVGMSVVSTVWNNTWNGLTGVVKGIWNGILGFIENGINGVISLINNMIRGVNAVGGAFGVNIGLIPNVHLPRLATGTVTNGPMVALIGDNPGGREVVAPYDSYVDEIRRAAGVGQTSSSSTASGPLRLAREDLDYLAEKLSGGLYDSIRLGSKRAITTALRG